MEYFLILTVLMCICLLIGVLTNGSTDHEIPEIPPYQPPQKSDGEKFSFRENYLHRHDAKRERRRRNQWPL